MKGVVEPYVFRRNISLMLKFNKVLNHSINEVPKKVKSSFFKGQGQLILDDLSINEAYTPTIKKHTCKQKSLSINNYQFKCVLIRKS